MSIISADDLAGLRESDDQDVVICDVRFSLADHDQGRREYDTAHLPGARFLDLHTELVGGPGGGRHPLPDVADFAALLGRLGIEPATVVVAYDAAGGATASRLWWMLRSIGHTRAAVLDGGIPAWIESGYPVDADEPDPAPVDYPVPQSWTGVVTADHVASAHGERVTVIDSRADQRFRGEFEPIDAQAGHVPGAINLFHGDVVDESGRMRPLDELHSRFSGLGAEPIVYCGSGVTACHNLLAMDLVGITDARLYPGSWSEWSSDPERPVATGVAD